MLLSFHIPLDFCFIPWKTKVPAHTWTQESCLLLIQSIVRRILRKQQKRSWTGNEDWRLEKLTRPVTEATSTEDRTVGFTCMMLDTGDWVYDIGLPSATEKIMQKQKKLWTIYRPLDLRIRNKVLRRLMFLPELPISSTSNTQSHCSCSAISTIGIPDRLKVLYVSINATWRGNASIRHLRDTIRRYPKNPKPEGRFIKIITEVKVRETIHIHPRSAGLVEKYSLQYWDNNCTDLEKPEHLSNAIERKTIIRKVAKPFQTLIIL